MSKQLKGFMNSELVFCNVCGKAYNAALINHKRNNIMGCVPTCCGYAIGDPVPSHLI